jgi:hypothetical protein
LPEDKVNLLVNEEGVEEGVARREDFWSRQVLVVVMNLTI